MKLIAINKCGQNSEIQMETNKCKILFQINATGTLVSTLMPALLPSCATHYEQGPTVMSGKIRDYLICVSPDGFIK